MAKRRKPKKISGKQFLSLVKERGVSIIMSKKGRESKNFHDLTALLFCMKMQGIIPAFEVKYET